MEHSKEHCSDPNCCCNSHEHHHEHHRHNHEHCNNEVNIEIHEGALVGSVKRSSHIPYRQLKEQFQCEINSLKNWVIDKNGHIGHIKGFIKCNEHTCAISTTGYDLTVTEKDGQESVECEINIVCIVFGIDKGALFERLEEIHF